MARPHQTVLYLTPAIVLVGLFLLIPLAVVFTMSGTQWSGVGTPDPVGLENFRTLAADPTFRLAVRNTLAWVLVGTVVHTPLCIVVALVIARRPRGWKFFRTVFFVPNVISAASLALLWYFVFHVKLGLVNTALDRIGLGDLARAWLSDPGTALWSTMTAWVLYIGFGMVLFLAQIGTIPREYYEAAQLDGASPLRQDLSITLPLIKPAIALQVLFVVGYALRSFEYPFIMTSGGPAGSSTTLSLYIYRQMMAANDYGLAMAAGVVTLLIGAVLTAVVFGVVRRTGR